MTSHRIVRGLSVIAALVAVAPAHAQKLPDARAVLTRYAKTTNAAKLLTLAGFSVKGTFEMPAAGLTGSVEQNTDRLGRTVSVVSLAGIGDVKEGVDTAFAWSIEPMQGPKLIEGKEFIEKREESDPRSMQRDPALVVEAETVERTTIDGQPCVKLKLKWKSGRTTVECYSEVTGLLVSKDETQPSSMGELQVTIGYSDYKTIGGVTLPMKSVQKAAGTEVTIRYTEVLFGAIDPAKLATPPEILALRKK